MKVLSMDTSSKICSVAINEDGKILDEIHNESEKEHSQTLMPMIKEILERNSLNLEDINLIAVCVGPRIIYWNKGSE